MTVHDRIDDLATLAAAGALSDSELRELEAHAAACADCAAALREARDFDVWLRGAVSPDRPPAGLEDRLVARLGAPKRRVLRAPRLLRWAAGLAAAVGLVLIGGRFTSAGDHTEADARNPSFAVEREELAIKGMASLPGATGMPESDRGRVDMLKRLELGADKYERAFGAYPPGTDGEVVRLKRDLKDQTLLTKLEADLQVFNRQNEVQLAQLQEANRRVLDLNRELDSRRRLGEAEMAKPPDVFNVETNVAVPGAPITDAVPATVTAGVTFNAETGKPLAGAEQLKSEFEFRADAPDGPTTLAIKPEPLPTQAAQKLVRNGRLHLEVGSYDETHPKLVAIVVEEKGFVADASTEKLQNGKTRASVTLRVPSDRFDAVVAKLRALGTVKNQSVAVEDMTKAYADVETRLAAKQAFLERLRKLLAEGKGDVKQLLEVEVQIGQTLEEIDRMKGELRFYDNRIALSTIVLEIAETDLGRPFEYVQTLASKIGLIAADADVVHAAAQKAVQDAGGRVADARVTRQSDGAATATLRARVDAARFPALREALRKLGHVATDTVDQQKKAQGGEPKADAPVRVEEAVVDLSVSTPAIHVSRRTSLTVETADVDGAYAAARKAIEVAGGRILEGQLQRQADGLRALVKGRLDADRHAGAVEALAALGKSKHQGASQSLPEPGSLVREQGEIELLLHTPPLLIGEERGLGKAVRDTFSNSVAGVLWSVEKLFVGLALAGPWIAVVALGWLFWRRRGGRPKMSQ
jgi:hypothetical protein